MPKSKSTLLNYRQRADEFKETMANDPVSQELALKAKKKGTVVSFAELSPEARSYNSKIGGMVSAEKRKKTLALAETMKTLLQLPLVDEDTIRSELSKRGIEGDTLTEATAICYTQIQRARLDSKAFEVVRDTIGQKPVEKQAISLDNTETASDIIRKHFGDDL